MVGDYGQPITFHLSGFSMVAGTTGAIRVRKPTGERIQWTASVNTSTRLATYSLAAGDLDAAGKWWLQLKTDGTNQNVHYPWVCMYVGEAFDA